MTIEHSAGGIILKEDGNTVKVLLIKNAALKDPSKAYWGFPKGHLEKGESEEDAAIREVKEETGVEVEVLEKLDDQYYMFTHPHIGKVSKTVTIFLMRYLEGEPQAQEKELLELGWFSIDDALTILSFNTDKTLLKKAMARITEA